MENCFVEGGVTRYTLKNDHWVEFKNELTYGERQRLNTGALRRMNMEAEVSIDLEGYSSLKLATWIADWSLVGSDKRPVAVSKDAIGNLRTSIADEIDALLEQHIVIMSGNGVTPSENEGASTSP